MAQVTRIVYEKLQMLRDLMQHLKLCCFYQRDFYRKQKLISYIPSEFPQKICCCQLLPIHTMQHEVVFLIFGKIKHI